MRTFDAASVVVAIKDCFAIDLWEEEFHLPFLESSDKEILTWGYENHKTIYRATLCFSLVSLRKVADFAENRRFKPNDVIISDFNLNLSEISGVTELIDSKLRTELNKTIAHFTQFREADTHELEALRNQLKSKHSVLEALGDEFFAMI